MHAQDDLDLRILRMFKGIFSPDVANMQNRILFSDMLFDIYTMGIQYRGNEPCINTEEYLANLF